MEYYIPRYKKLSADSTGRLLPLDEGAHGLYTLTPWHSTFS